MSTVIGDEDSGWVSMTTLTSQQRTAVADIHKASINHRPKTVTEQYVESMVGFVPEVKVDTNIKAQEIGDFTFCGCASAGKTEVKCGKHIDPSSGTTAMLYGPKSDSTSTSPKALDSFHKIPVNLCPASAIIAIALVIAQGHKKPGRTIYNWRDKSQKISYMDYHAAALRHLLKSIDGSDFDQELSELAGVSVRHDWAAMSCLAILEDARQAGTLVDDRPTKGGAEDFLDNLTVKK